MHCPVTELAKQLISRESVSPDDNGCQALMTERLIAAGFTVEPMPFGDTQNFWAYRGGNGTTLAFAGHTDVVPPGDLSQWRTPPFEPALIDGMLYGRGAADMKGSLAAMIVAAERFTERYPDSPGRLAFLITSDEEASAVNGTVKVVETLMTRHEKVEYCLVGEPSCQSQLGDMIKNGRRGSITANLTIHGTQGHVAYPHLADNPVHRAAPFIQELVTEHWDSGNQFFPPTSMQIANIRAGTGSNNIIPGELFIQFNFRFSTESTAESLKARIAALLEKHQLKHTIHWSLSGHPFLTPEGLLTDAVRRAIGQYCNLTPELSTSGGTSDGRFIARMGTHVVELGPINATIHKVNECVSAADLQQLSRIYQRIMEQILL